MQSNLSSIELIEDRIALLTISNGPKNLISEPEFIDTQAFLGWIKEYPNLEALIISGEGKNFSYGADVSRFGGSDDPEKVKEALRKGRQLLNVIENLPILTVASIGGACFGAGLEIALSCQFRICSPKAFLGLPEVMHGVVPGMGGMERLYRLLGKEKAIQMCLSGEMMSASDAQAIGLVTTISKEKQPLDETICYVKDLLGDKSVEQIKAVIGTINRAALDEEDPSQDTFVELLKKMHEKDVSDS